jgi:hypothetical protein
MTGFLMLFGYLQIARLVQAAQIPALPNVRFRGLLSFLAALASMGIYSSFSLVFFKRGAKRRAKLSTQTKGNLCAIPRVWMQPAEFMRIFLNGFC